MTASLVAGSATRVEVELAPYALVRLAAVRHPAAPAAAAPFRAALDRLVSRLAAAQRVAPALGVALHDAAPEHDPRFHRSVVLPLRRDVHNGRSPRPALRAALGDLPDRLPALAGWLAARDEIDRLAHQLAAAAPAALDAERVTLARVCAAEPLRRAVTLVSGDLLRGVERTAAGGGRPDARTRKAEPTVLRYALRTTAKTSPLSWFTHVAWATWTPADDAPESDGPGAEGPRADGPRTDGPETDGQPGRDGPPEEVELGPAVGSAALNHARLAPIAAAVLADPRRRDRLPHRLAPGLRIVEGQLRFRRDLAIPGLDRLDVRREEEVRLPHNRALEFVIDEVRRAGRGGAVPERVAAAVAARLPGPPDRTGPEALGYLRQLVAAGLLVPVSPYHPQDPAAARAFADWLDRHDGGGLATLLRRLQAGADAFPDVPARERPAALERLTRQWRDAEAAAGTHPSAAAPLTEDVVRRGRLRLGPARGAAAARELPGIAALVELFDQHLLLRRQVRDRFVARYGPGGRCADPVGFAGDLGDVWRAVNLVGPDGAGARGDRAGELPAELRELAEARAALTAAVRAAAGDPTEVRLPARVLTEAADALPGWARGRPASYSFFVQPARTGDGTLLVVNHVYAGFGRFTSRFLHLLDPAARVAVAAQLRRTFGPAARLAQFRPVNGFNANLHPLVVPDEVAEDPAWAGITTDQLELRHDPVADQVRLHHRESGESVDVLYLGFLVPFVLPDRFASLYGDLGGGFADLDHLRVPATVDGASVRPRLRHADVVLARRSWTLPAALAGTWRSELDAGGEVPALAAARARARWGLPEHVFVGSGERGIRGPDDLRDYLGRAKPQYADLGNALHLRCLSRLLGRHRSALLLTEALPVPGAQSPGGRVAEYVAETYRRGA